jgi:hypothetical protein
MVARLAFILKTRQSFERFFKYINIRNFEVFIKIQNILKQSTCLPNTSLIVDILGSLLPHPVFVLPPRLSLGLEISPQLVIQTVCPIFLQTW